MLCPRCERFNLQDFADGFPLRGYAGSQTSCAFCGPLFEQISQVQTLPNRKGYWWRLWPSLILDSNTEEVHLWLTRSELNTPISGTGIRMEELNAIGAPRIFSLTDTYVKQSSITFQTAADPGTSAYSSGDVKGTILTDTSAWTQQHFDSIKSWHDKCRKEHPDCSTTLSKRRNFNVANVTLPTRYLQIFPADTADGNSKFNVRFVLRESHGETGSYVALSHRWTKANEETRTTRANYECRLGTCWHGLQCSTWTDQPLTKLFLEASWLAMNVGVNRIWIDSICIIQDSLEDWKNESLKMAEYYQFAWLTISATHTTTGGGLRDDFQPEDLAPIARLPYRDKNGKRDGYFYIQALERAGLAKDYRANISESPLVQRGWVFQEWLLSRRILSFSASSWGIFTQCRDGNGPKAMINHIVDVQNNQIYQRLTKIEESFGSLSKSQKTSIDNLYASWRSVVEAYSGLELSFMKADRIVALSGIADEFGQALQKLYQKEGSHSQRQISSPAHIYAAGMWVRDIRGLLWEQCEDQAPSRIDGLPTWSWASLENKAAHENGHSSRGVNVKWPEELKTDCGEIVLKISDTTMIDIDTDTWQPKVSEPLDRNLPSIYGNVSRFAVLKVRCRTLQVLLDAQFTPDDLQAVADLSGYHPTPDQTLWRRVATYKTPDMVAGWASIEHPDLQTDAACRTDNGIVAVPVVKMRSARGAFGMGNVFGRSETYRVLYCRKVNEFNFPTSHQCYERVGVGRLFEREVHGIFGAVEEETICFI